MNTTTQAAPEADTEIAVMAIAFLAVAEHVLEHDLPLPYSVDTPLGSQPPYLRLRVSGAGDQLRWLNTVHVDGEDIEPLGDGSGAQRWTWHVRLPDTGTRVELIGLREADVKPLRLAEVPA